MNAVIFEANYDTVTARVHAARRKVLSALGASPRVDLLGSRAVAAEVRTAHKSLGAIYLFSGMGHGDPDEFCGQLGLKVYDKADSVRTNYTTRETIVHLYSCECALGLGPHLISKGAKAFIGYTRPVSVPTTQAVVDEFVKVAAVIDESILAGDRHRATKLKADTEARSIEGRLRSSPVATPRDLAQFRLNQAALAGPWSSPMLGSY